MSKNKRIGKIGEDLAANYLTKRGYKIVQKNFFTPLGEIDLIVQKHNTLFFVEVKTRTNGIFGSGLEAITTRKIEKIQKAAEIYITDKGWSGLVQLLLISILYRSQNWFDIEVVEAN